ncbi:Protein transport protein SEC24 [Gracilariopsis chorda]|uniref:Protein transport protein SEC24 n=1 Tax=Gracilariopsis chorda TaxID=448386 RepID=A0A2V3IW74_9FLOR|nr:Protein transport protein SEC24 [Gracilariopsis chorda]|eukprot:PXF46323.1 Protein transport protein SEC24 [Gracilariopsis chorda]
MLRPTSARIPANAAVQTRSAVPCGVLVTPLSPSPPPRSTLAFEASLPPAALASYKSAAATTSTAIPRCTACRAYIGAACNMNARYWACAICSQRNTLPTRYSPILLAPPEALHIVPELSRHLYDLPVENIITPPPTAYIFLVDANGDQPFMDAARKAIRQALLSIQGVSIVGIMLYDHNVTLLDLRAEILRHFSPQDPSLNASHVFPPDQWFRTTNNQTVSKIVSMLAKFRAKEHAQVSAPTKSALGTAVKAALDMIETAQLLAARVLVLAATEPNFGDGAIQHASHPLPDDQQHPPKPLTRFYEQAGVRANLLGAMFDVYISSKTPVHVASLAPLAQISGGRLTMYESGEESLSADVWQHLNDPAVVRGLLRVRTSSCIPVADVYGCGVYQDSEVPEVYRLSCHGHTSTLAVEFRASEESPPANVRFASVQVAFQGVFIEPGSLPQRVLRVQTQSYALTGSGSVIRKEADSNAIATMLFHQAIATADEKSIGAARMLLFDWLANLFFRAAKKAEAGDTPGIDGNLTRYPALQPVPRLIFGLIRSFLFRQEPVDPDSRAALRCIWEDLSPELLAAAAYPRLYSFLNLHEKNNHELPLSSAAVKECGHPIFLLDAFSDVVIFYATSSRKDLQYPPPESSVVMRVRGQCVRDRPVAPKCVVCREGTPKDRWFKSFLIEDPLPGAAAQSFSAFIQGVADAAEGMLQSSKKQ